MTEVKTIFLQINNIQREVDVRWKQKRPSPQIRDALGIIVDIYVV